MRGIKSYAMVLCADSVDGSKVEFIEPPAGSNPGDRVYFEGFEGKDPETLLNPKKKIWETIQPGFITSDSFEAGWVDQDKKFHKLLVNGNVCKSQSIAGGPMK
ncbi:tRNA-aminoacylation cofactor arc1 [Smittium culicis]|nr:tRNA-aminoacylation cofactor arc1 [Smittium culicis]